MPGACVHRAEHPASPEAPRHVLVRVRQGGVVLRRHSVSPIGTSEAQFYGRSSPRCQKFATPMLPACQPPRRIGRVHDVGLAKRVETRSDVSPVAFEAFFRTEFPRLLNLSSALVGDRAQAEDLTQEALLRAHRAWATVGMLESPGGWTRLVLLNLIRDAMRRRKHERRPHQSLGTSSSVVDDLLSGEWWAAVRRLPVLQRSVVALHYIDDMSISDVSTVLGVSAGSVKSSLSRARAALTRALASERPNHAISEQGRRR